MVENVVVGISRDYLKNNIEVEVLKRNGKVSGKIFCPVEDCGTPVTVAARGNGIFINSNFVRHLIKKHGYEIKKNESSPVTAT